MLLIITLVGYIGIYTKKLLSLFRENIMSGLSHKKASAAIVIGGGFGGIAAALRLRGLGYEVTLYDRLSRLGGKAQVYVREGFRYDAGPTMISHPELLDELFRLFNRSLHDEVKLLPLQTGTKFYFSDGATFQHGATIDETLLEIAKINKKDCQGYLKLLEKTDADREASTHSLLKWIPTQVKSTEDLISTFIENPHVRDALVHQAKLVNGNPSKICEWRSAGIFFPAGGVGSLVDALQKLMEESGIDVQLNKTVKKINIEDGKVKDIELQDGHKVHCDMVVVNSDPAYVYKHLIDKSFQGKWKDKKLEKLHFSQSVFILYFGTNKKYDDVPQHNFLMGDVEIYLHRPTSIDSSFAPKNCDSFYASILVPNLKEPIDWCQAGTYQRDKILNKLEKTLLPELRQHLVQDFHMTPKDFQNSYLSLYGSGFGTEEKFPHAAAEVDNLYFVGAGTEPGPGIAGVLNSAKMIENIIRNKV